MNPKRVTPYTRLLNRVKEFCDKLVTRKVKTIFTINKSSGSYCINDLLVYLKAGELLGYEVRVVLDQKKESMVFEYIEKMPVIPWDWRS